MMVTVPLIVDAESGVNDMLDRDGSRTPDPIPHLERPRRASRRRAGGAGGHQVEAHGAEAVRHASRARACAPTCAPCARTTSSITTTAPTWTSGTGSAPSPAAAQSRIPERDRQQHLESDRGRRVVRCRNCSRSCKAEKYPNLPEKLTFLHAEEMLQMYPDLPRKQRETADPAGVSRDLHHRHRLDARGRLSARNARRRLRRLGHRDRSADGRRCTA